jgi:hypothetical protein
MFRGKAPSGSKLEHVLREVRSGCRDLAATKTATMVLEGFLSQCSPT